ncbi:MAG: PAS domain-containing protein, partial [Alphaproteobacteria bacterium]|nr:PAS domain-containing protein [Alphaproteobacteria bacterium]
MDWQVQLEAMTAERDHLLHVLRSMGDAVVCADGAGVITFLNPKAEALTGWARDDALGQPIATVLPFSREDDHQTVLDPVRHCQRAG